MVVFSITGLEREKEIRDKIIYSFLLEQKKTILFHTAEAVHVIENDSAFM